MILEQAYRDMPEQAWTLSFQALTTGGDTDPQKQAFLTSLTYYRFKLAHESGKGLGSITLP